MGKLDPPCSRYRIGQEGLEGQLVLGKEHWGAWEDSEAEKNVIRPGGTKRNAPLTTAEKEGV